MTAPEVTAIHNTYPMRGEHDLLEHVQIADSLENMVQRPENLSEQSNVDVLYFGPHPVESQISIRTVFGHNNNLGVVTAYEPESVVPGGIFSALSTEALADGEAPYKAQVKPVKTPDLNFEPRPGDEQLNPVKDLGLAYLYRADGYDVLKVRVPSPSRSEGRISPDQVLSFAVKNNGKPLIYDQVIDTAQNAFPGIFTHLAQSGIWVEDQKPEQTPATSGVVIRPYKEMNLEGGVPFPPDNHQLTEVPTPSEGEVRSRLADLAAYLAESEKVALFENHAGGKGLTKKQIRGRVTTASKWQIDQTLNVLGVSSDTESAITPELVDYLDQPENDRESWLASHGLDNDTINHAYELRNQGPLGFDWDRETQPPTKEKRLRRVAKSLGKVIPFRGKKRAEHETEQTEITTTGDFETDNSAETTQDLTPYYDENGKLLPSEGGTIKERVQARAEDIQNKVLMGPESDKGWFYDKDGKLSARRIGAAALFGIAAVAGIVGLFSLGGSSSGGGSAHALPWDRMPKGPSGATNPSDVFHPGSGAAQTTTPELPQTGAAQTTQQNIPPTSGSGSQVPSHDHLPSLTPDATHQPGSHDTPPHWIPGHASDTGSGTNVTGNAPSHIKLAPGQSIIGYLHDARPRMSDHDLYMEAKRIMEANGIPTNAPGHDPLAAARFIRAGRDLVAPGL